MLLRRAPRSRATARPRPALLAVALAACALGAAPAWARHWPQAGGDAGRSGYQPVGDGDAPVEPLWAAEGDVITALVVGDGDFDEQRVVYGTADGRVHLRRLASGEPVGSSAGVSVEPALGGSAFGAVEAGARPGFAILAARAARGRVLVVHRVREAAGLLGGAGSALAVSVIDERSGEVVERSTLAGSLEHQPMSPVALAPPGEGHPARLAFLAARDSGAPGLFVVDLRDGRVAHVQRREVPGADPLAAPAIARLEGSHGVEPHALLAAADGVRSVSLADVSRDGPGSTEPRGRLGSPAVPPAANGTAAGHAASLPGAAPLLYVPAQDGESTRVARLVPSEGRLVLEAMSPPLAGVGASGLAVAQEVVAGEPGGGWIAVPTSRGLWVLDARTLAPVGRVGAGGAGFTRGVPAALGRLAFALRDDGSALAVDLERGAALGSDRFATHPRQAGSRRSLGQPAVSNGLVVVASDRGVAVLRTRCGTPVAGSPADDAITGGPPGEIVAGRAGDDALAGGDGHDCLDGGSGTDRVRGERGDDVVAGRAGDDVLSGGEGADDLRGGPGRDRLSGGPGHDRLVAGAGSDGLSGGPGDDRLNLRGGGADRARCGPGRDFALADARDRVARDCERVDRR